MTELENKIVDRIIEKMDLDKLIDKIGLDMLTDCNAMLHANDLSHVKAIMLIHLSSQNSQADTFRERIENTTASDLTSRKATRGRRIASEGRGTGDC